MQSKQTWNTNASQKQPPVTLRGTMQVLARYSEVIVELYRKNLGKTKISVLVTQSLTTSFITFCFFLLQNHWKPCHPAPDTQ